MSVFGSLFTAVSALAAQSQSLGMISNNISNVSTVGFKRVDAAFQSLVTNTNRTSAYSPGSVNVVQNARVDQQGILQQSSSATDIAISGNGFFVVKTSTDIGAEPMYTRAGSFSQDQDGVLRNTAGFALMGWPLGPDGSLPAAQADISSVVPVNVAFTGGLTQPTSTASLALNLNSAQAQVPFPVAPGFTPDFTRDIKVFDSLGAGHNLTLNFKKITTPTAKALGTQNLSGVVGPLAGNFGIAAGNTFDISIPGASFPATAATLPAVRITIGATTTVADLIAQLNAVKDIDNNPMIFAALDASGQLSIKARPLNSDITLTNVSGTPLTGLAVATGAHVAPTVTVATDMLTGTAPPNTNSTEGWWTVEFKTPTGAVVKSGSINFGGDGKLNATLDSLEKTNINVAGIDWANGSNTQDIAFDIAGFTQFSGEYNVIGSSQNGAALGLRTGVSIDNEGFVTAQFSNGQSTKIYKLPIVTFANPNGLNEISGNVFRQSDSSGDFNLREAGKGSAGSIQGGALESSNVDLAEEFSKMIVTQRAYSANTKVITTADQMTEELLRLR